jgi:hypothetical protein
MGKCRLWRGNVQNGVAAYKFLGDRNTHIGGKSRNGKFKRLREAARLLLTRGGWHFIHLHQPRPQGVSGCVRSIDSAYLVVDIAHVPSHCSFSNNQFFSNLPVALTCGDSAQYFHLSLAQAVGIGSCETPRLALLLKGSYPLS